jgi:uncharacterized protein YjbI with pentapeptide repeats
MKKPAALMIGIMLFAASAFARTDVRAEDILRSIDAGQVVEYVGVKIVGDLDLTSIRDREPAEGSWSFFGLGREYVYHVRSPLIFRDCIFDGDVIGYRQDSWGNQAHIVLFHENVIFQQCEFRRASAFKYSKFFAGADFRNSVFHEEALFKYAHFSAYTSFVGSKFSGSANFKYAHFSTEARFADCAFSDDANFKYTNFSDAVDFTGSIFHHEADFKYTRFPQGASFVNAIFRGGANFKYARFSEPSDFEGMRIEASADFKYTKLEGRPFAPPMYNNIN